MTIGEICSEPLIIHGMGTRQERQKQVQEMLAGGRPQPRAHQPVSPPVLRRATPAHRHCPRVDAPAASMIICDEPVSALDVSIQAQIINLLEDLQERIRTHLPVHRARPLRRAPHLRPDRGDVPGQDRRDRPIGENSTKHRTTPTLNPCSRPCRCPTRRSNAPAPVLSCRGMSPAPSSPPPAGAVSIPAAPSPQLPLCSEQEPDFRRSRARTSRRPVTSPSRSPSRCRGRRRRPDDDDLPADRLYSDAARVVAGGLDLRVARSSRKVRTPQSRVLDNVQRGKPSGKCHRNDTARRGGPPLRLQR